MAYTEQNRGRGVCEVRATGAKGNGGYFDSTIVGGSDLTQQDAAALTLTDMATNAAGTTVTSVTGGFTSSMIGNAINMVSGTGVDVGADGTSVYWITAVGSTNSCTIDRSAGASATGITGSIGGARASIGGALANQASGGGTTVYVKGGSYTCTSSTSNIDNGRGTLIAGSATFGPTRVIGYSTTRTDCATGTPVTVTFAFGATFLDGSAAGTEISGIGVQCSNTASSLGFLTGANSSVLWCKAYQAVTGFRGTSGNIGHCIADSCGAGFGDATASVSNLYGCWAKDTVTTFGIRCASGSIITNCLATGGASHGFYIDTGGNFTNCAAVGNTGSGFQRANSTPARPAVYTNCLSAYNTTYGYEDLVTNPNMRLVNCASVGNTTARSTGVRTDFDNSPVTLSGDPFRDRTNKDFRLNTFGPGIVCRSQGIFNTFQGYATLLRNSFIGAYPTLEKAPSSSWPNAQGWPNAQ